MVIGIALAAHMQPGSKSGWRTFETDISLPINSFKSIHPYNISMMMPQIERDPSTSLLSNESDQRRRGKPLS